MAALSCLALLSIGSSIENVGDASTKVSMLEFALTAVLFADTSLLLVAASLASTILATG